eukprot:3232728-Rhodomonas_salina.1
MASGNAADGAGDRGARQPRLQRRKAILILRALLSVTSSRLSCQCIARARAQLQVQVEPGHDAPAESSKLVPGPAPSQAESDSGVTRPAESPGW